MNFVASPALAVGTLNNSFIGWECGPWTITCGVELEGDAKAELRKIKQGRLCTRTDPHPQCATFWTFYLPP